MLKPRRGWRRWAIGVGLALGGLAVALVVAWVSLTYQPRFYRRARVAVSRAELESEAGRFVAQTSHLYNDMRNEPSWMAVFSDQEVNAWLARDLVEQFADLIPPQVHDPRVAFEPDRVTLAFGVDRGPIRMVVSVVARVRMAEDDVVAVTVEAIRAGAFPVDSRVLIERVTEQAEQRGIDLKWEQDSDGLPMALIRYMADPDRRDVVLERVALREGSVVLVGRSGKGRPAVALPRLPDRRVLQGVFPSRRKIQPWSLPGSPPSA